MLSHRELRRYYLDINRKYFDGKLPEDADVLFAPTPGCHAWLCEDNAGPVVTIDPKFAISSDLWKQSLLHECAHYSSTDWKHGRRFRAEIDRLYVVGAYRGLL